jgi:hypothetical protein
MRRGGKRKTHHVGETQTAALAAAGEEASWGGGFGQGWRAVLCLIREIQWWKGAAEKLGETGSVVCLVQRGDASTALLVEKLAQVSHLKVKEAAALEDASLVLPSCGRAVVLVGRGLQSEFHKSLTAWEKLESDYQKLLDLRRAPEEAKERIHKVALSFAQVSVLVVGDLDLAKALYLENPRWPNVEVIACAHLKEAADQVGWLAKMQTLSKRAVQEELQELHKNLRTNTLGAPSVTSLIWHQVGIPDAQERGLCTSDLMELLSGRASQAIAEEQYGLDPATARSVLQAMQKNTDIEM